MEGKGKREMEREREIQRERKKKSRRYREHTKKEKRTKERPHRGIAEGGLGKVQESTDLRETRGNYWKRERRKAALLRRVVMVVLGEMGARKRGCGEPEGGDILEENI